MDPLTHSFGDGVPHIHGHNGVGEVELPHAVRKPEAESAADMLVRLAHQYPGELDVVAIGPLTNLAVALKQDPSIAELVHEVIIMGGAALVPGNLSAVGEANIYNDPEAAQVVMEAPWQVIMVPLDVTLENTFEESDREALAASESALNRALADILDLYLTSTQGVRPAHVCPARPAGGGDRDRPDHRHLAPNVPVVVDDTQAPDAARPSATCATNATAPRTSRARTSAWCWRPTSRSARSCWSDCSNTPADPGYGTSPPTAEKRAFSGRAVPMWALPQRNERFGGFPGRRFRLFLGGGPRCGRRPQRKTRISARRAHTGPALHTAGSGVSGVQVVHEPQVCVVAALECEELIDPRVGAGQVVAGVVLLVGQVELRLRRAPGRPGWVRSAMSRLPSAETS